MIDAYRHLTTGFERDYRRPWAYCGDRTSETWFRAAAWVGRYAEPFALHARTGYYRTPMEAARALDRLLAKKETES